MNKKFILLASVAIFSLGITSESLAACSDGCTDCRWNYTWNCYKCIDEKDLVGGRCVDKCPSTQERIDGVCVEKCASTQKRINGRCVSKCDADEIFVNGICSKASACSSGGGYKCKESNGSEVANCCFKSEGNTTTFYPEDSAQNYSIPKESSFNTNLVITAGTTVNGNIFGYFENVVIPENINWMSCGCCWYSPKKLQHLIISDEQALQPVRLNCITGDNTKVVCLGDIDRCKTNVGSNYADRVVAPTKEQCDGIVGYYFTGENCLKRPADPTDMVCVGGYAKLKGNCVDPLKTFAKKRYTPAEAAQWLNEDNNTITLTFKKQ